MSEEMIKICNNCKYHYIEDISFDYPQSCCNKRKAIIEKWFNCSNFEYSEDYIKNLQEQAELGEHYKHLYSEVKKQKDDVVEYIKKQTKEFHFENDKYIEILRMLGEIDE